jgi:hypothetical protein
MEKLKTALLATSMVIVGLLLALLATIISRWVPNYLTAIGIHVPIIALLYGSLSN